MNHLKQVSEGGFLLEKYQKLEEVLKEVSKNPDKDLSEELFFAKEQLRTLLLQKDPSDLEYDAYRLFEKIDKHSVFGKPAADYIQELLSSEDKDYVEIQTELSNKIKILSRQTIAIEQFFEIIDQDILSEMVHNSDKKEIKSGLYLHFEGQVAVRDINDLERYTRIWNGILQSFSDLTGYGKQSLEFCNLHEEYIVLGVVTEGSTLEAFMKGTIGIVNSLNLIIKIRKIQTEISPLPLTNDYFELLNDEIQHLINQTAISVTDELVNSYYQGIPTDLSRVSENLCRSLKQILNFVDKGGKLECKTSSETIDGQELSAKFVDSFLNLKKAGLTAVRLPEKQFILESGPGLVHA
jgi:hypothetical protein